MSGRVPEGRWAPPVAERRKLEAMGDAVRLGHQRMTAWLALPTDKHPYRWMARCWDCDGLVLVYADDGRISGDAAVLRCSGRPPRPRRR